MSVLVRCIAGVTILVVLQGGLSGAAVSSGSATATTAMERPAATPFSGIEGRIVAGPTCPEARGSQCGDRPYQATVVVKTRTGSKEIMRYRSSEDGRFRVQLPPGTYLLVPLSRSRLPRAGSQTVVVRQNQFTRVVIRYDTGIR